MFIILKLPRPFLPSQHGAGFAEQRHRPFRKLVIMKMKDQFVCLGHPFGFGVDQIGNVRKRL